MNPGQDGPCRHLEFEEEAGDVEIPRWSFGLWCGMLAGTAYALTPGSWNKGIFKTLMEGIALLKPLEEGAEGEHGLKWGYDSSGEPRNVQGCNGSSNVVNIKGDLCKSLKDG